MMTLPAELEHFMQGKDLKGLKPFAFLYRNKWNSATNKYALESTPIDISALIAKPNTLSMTLDVNEIAQYNANNVTLTLSDTKNYFVEGTPNSYFPDGYQLYGSRVVLYYGLDGTNRTPLFTGVIKDLPTHKPEQYQVDLKLVSPLEMLKDIEAKDFSDKVTGETLTYKGTDSDGHRIYWTSSVGVGGFYGVYANGTKLFEGVDYEVSETSTLSYNAVVTIINSTFYNSIITADYYIWKRNLKVEQIVQGLVGLAGYNSSNEDIRNVAWANAVRNPLERSGVAAAIGYYQNDTYSYKYNWKPTVNTSWSTTSGGSRTHILTNNFDFSFQIQQQTSGLNLSASNAVSIGDAYNANVIYSDISTFGTNYEAGINGVYNGISIRIFQIRSDSIQNPMNNGVLYVHRIINGSATLVYRENIGQGVGVLNSGTIKITRRGNNVVVYRNNTQIFSATISTSLNFDWQGSYKGPGASVSNAYVLNQTWNIYDSSLRLIGANLTKPCLISTVNDKTINGDTWLLVSAALSPTNGNYFLNCYFSNDANIWSSPIACSLNTAIGNAERYMYFILGVNNVGNSFDISDLMTQYIATTLVLNIANLSDLTVLEALQDFALISGYEFGVDRQGVFFFRPRVQSTTPQYVLDHDEIVKVNTVKKNLNDFFTKLTLTFAQRPLEFYANTGDRPTLVDKYGIINKEIDKPDIVNYDNPELAQAIGPQLLETYASLSNTIQAVCKINLALELGDIVSLRRNMNLITPDRYTDYSKYTDLNTYYRACKIIGLNYNFEKRQITYTLRDVSNPNTEPGYEFEHYIYDLAVPFGVKE